MPGLAYYEQSISEFSFFAGFGDPIRNHKVDPTTHPAPKALFLIYITMNGQKLIVRHMEEYDIEGDKDDIKEAEIRLLQDAKANLNVVGRNFERMTWDEPCYITMVLDIPGWKFYWRDNPNQDPIVFLQYKDLRGIGAPAYTKNTTFFDAELDDITPSSSYAHKALRFINHFRDENDKPLHGKDLRYCFEIYLEAPFFIAGQSSYITILIDPDGQNQGPQP
jgi:hypothetical protein